MNCEVIRQEGIAERYLRGELSEAEAETFERHYFACASCFDELEIHRALRQALRETTDRAGIGPSTLRRGPASGWAWAAAAALAAGVAGLGWWWWFTAGDGQPAKRESSAQERPAAPQPAAPPSTPAPVSPPSETSRRGPVPVPSLATLAAIDPPPYTPTVLRGVQDQARRRFRDAMHLYTKGDFTAAASDLAIAAQLDPQAPDAAFFLGVCRLLTGEAEAAITELRRTVDLGESPYLEEAHFYLAKAHLQRGDIAAASAALENTMRLHGPFERESRGLLEALRRIPDGRRPP